MYYLLPSEIRIDEVQKLFVISANAHFFLSYFLR